MSIIIYAYNINEIYYKVKYVIRNEDKGFQFYF